MFEGKVYLLCENNNTNSEGKVLSSSEITISYSWKMPCHSGNINKIWYDLKCHGSRDVCWCVPVKGWCSSRFGSRKDNTSHMNAILNKQKKIN